MHTYLINALPVWASTCKTYLVRSQRLQNKALRIISKTLIKNNITAKFYKLGILKLNDLFTFEIAKNMYQFTYKKLPTCFYSFFTYSADVLPYSTRQIATKDISLPRLTTLKSQRSIKHIGPKIWNSIPGEIRKLSYSMFKELTKNFS